MAILYFLISYEKFFFLDFKCFSIHSDVPHDFSSFEAKLTAKLPLTVFGISFFFCKLSLPHTTHSDPLS